MTVSDATKPRITYRGEAWTAVVPAGTYFLGDPCYAVHDEEWRALITSAGCFISQPVGATPDGHQVLAFNAPDVPGVFHDAGGTEYLCDSGLLGLVPLAVFATSEKQPRYGRTVTFDRKVECSCDGRTWRFGPFTITEDSDDDRA